MKSTTWMDKIDRANLRATPPKATHLLTLVMGKNQKEMLAWLLAAACALGGPATIADGHVMLGLLLTIGGWSALIVGVWDLLNGGRGRRSRRR